VYTTNDYHQLGDAARATLRDERGRDDARLLAKLLAVCADPRAHGFDPNEVGEWVEVPLLHICRLCGAPACECREETDEIVDEAALPAPVREWYREERERLAEARSERYHEARRGC
jgi:hypothetical protein